MAKVIYKSIARKQPIRFTEKEWNTILNGDEVRFVLGRPETMTESYWWCVGLNDFFPTGIAIHEYECNNCGYRVKASEFQRNLPNNCPGCGCKML